MTQLLQPPPMNRSATTERYDYAPDDGEFNLPVRRRVAFLTNEVPPYRIPLYHELARTPGWDFRVFTCIDREMDRLWDIRQSFPFVTKRSFSLSYVRRLRHGGRERFDDSRQIHLPIGHLCDLYRFAPDVIISGELGARTAIAALYARLFRTRLVVYYEGTPHTDRDLSTKQRFVRRVIRRAPHAYMVNGRQGRNYLEGIAVPSDTIFEIGEAVDAESFERQRTAEQRATVRNELGVHGECYLFCGALIPRKGLDQLLDAWEVFARTADVDATLVIVGEGPERARLERRTSDAGLTNVRFLGHLQRARLPAIYHAADVFVFPTLEDCWALVVNEAMVAGLPVINSKYAGSAELISDGVNGWVIDPLDKADLVRGLNAAWASRHDRETKRRAARRAVAAMSIPAVAGRIRQTVDYVRRERLRGVER
jgi:glycosyltransferase involved in cell wall biosynthesis